MGRSFFFFEYKPSLGYGVNRAGRRCVCKTSRLVVAPTPASVGGLALEQRHKRPFKAYELTAGLVWVGKLLRKGFAMNLRSHGLVAKPCSPLGVAVAMFSYPILDTQSATSLENLVIETSSIHHGYRLVKITTGCRVRGINLVSHPSSLGLQSGPNKAAEQPPFWGQRTHRPCLSHLY